MAAIRNECAVRMLKRYRNRTAERMHRFKFSLATWDRWRADRTPNERTLERRQGIQEMRSLLAIEDDLARLWK